MFVHVRIYMVQSTSMWYWWILLYEYLKGVPIYIYTLNLFDSLEICHPSRLEGTCTVSKCKLIVIKAKSLTYNSVYPAILVHTTVEFLKRNYSTNFDDTKLIYVHCIHYQKKHDVSSFSSSYKLEKRSHLCLTFLVKE